MTAQELSNIVENGVDEVLESMLFQESSLLDSIRYQILKDLESRPFADRFTKELEEMYIKAVIEYADDFIGKSGVAPTDNPGGVRLQMVWVEQ